MVSSSQPNLPAGSANRRKQRRHVSIEDDPGQREGSLDLQRTAEGAAVPEVPVGGREASEEREEEEEDVQEERHDLQELFQLAHRALPDLPPPVPEAGEENGWHAIHRLGALNSFLCKFSLLQDCPEQHKSAWARAHGHVLQKWREAFTQEEIDTALLWLGFLPQALLRKPSRGGKAGRSQVAHRFNCITNADWAGLVEAWEGDVRRREEKGENKRREEEEEGNAQAEARLRREVVSLIEAGQVSRAMQRMTSHGLADMADPAVLTQLQDKFPARQDTLPPSVPSYAPIDSFIGLREKLLSMDTNRGSSPGCGGMRPEFLAALGDRLEDGELENLEIFALQYAAGKLPPWLYRLWLSTQTVPMHKTAARDAIRPIGIRHSWPRLFHKEIISQSKPEIREFLEPQQLGQSQAGAAKLTHAVRGLLELNSNFICVSTDIKNCYNEQNRAAAIEVLKSTDSLEHLTTFAASILAPVSALEAKGQIWGSSGTGKVQGDPASGALQALGFQPCLEELDAACSEGGGMTRAGADDVFAIGLPSVVFPAIEKFAENIRAKCNLELQRAKCKVYLREGELPPETPEGLTLAGEEVDGEFLRGFLCFGVPIGSEAYVTHKLQEQANEIIKDGERARQVLGSNYQSLWSTLRLSIANRFQYWMQLTPPSICEPVARELDNALWNILEASSGFKIPRGGEEGGLELRIPDIPALDHKSFQEFAIRLPARLHGWGFRSLEDACGPAYLATLETAIPFMAGAKGICPQMSALWGDEECWGEAAPPESRWRQLLASDCSIAGEMRRSWSRIQLEASQSADFLQEPTPEILSTQLESLGGGSTTGETRKKIVDAIECTRSKILTKALSLVRPTTTRAAWAWKQRDKVSSAWLLACPGPDTRMSNSEFTEAAAANLCLPSPACLARVGETVKGRVKLDPYGDNIQATALQGDHWRTRHTWLVQFIHRACMWAGVSAEMEVFNLFSGHVRQEGLSRLEKAKQRQSLVPDLRIAVQPQAVADAEVRRDLRIRGQGPRGGGGTVESGGVLHEVKIISCSKSRYKPNSQKRAVDARADLLPQEYLNKAKAADRVHNQIPAGTVGPVERRLNQLGEVRGIVAGNFGEVSEHTHSLLAALATYRVRVTGVSRGRKGHLRSEEAERAIAISSLRRRLGVLTNRCQTYSLLGRLETLGPGSSAAAGRRIQASQLENSWRREERAHILAVSQGFNSFRTGFGKLD